MQRFSERRGGERLSEAPENRFDGIVHGSVFVDGIEGRQGQHDVLHSGLFFAYSAFENERLADLAGEQVDRTRLGEVVENPVAKTFENGPGRTVAGQHQHRDLGGGILDLPQRFVAVHARHLHVEHNHVESRLLDLFDRLDSAPDRLDVESTPGQDGRGGRAEAVLVVHQQQSYGWHVRNAPLSLTCGTFATCPLPKRHVENVPHKVLNRHPQSSRSSSLLLSRMALGEL